jgi:HSP20 family protein
MTTSEVSTNHGDKELIMANQQNKQQGERASSTMAKTDEGERGLATRQYQDPFSLLDTVFERMQRDFFGTTLLNALLPTRGGDGNGGGAIRVPRVQMRDTGDAIELTAELPGIEGENVRVELEDDVLTISGEAQAEEETEEARVERYVSFYRQIPLPEGIDPEQAQASYRNGILSLRFPKREARSSARQIPVTTEQTGQPSAPQPSAQQQTGQQTKERAA